jgi:hypothetical protein
VKPSILALPDVEQFEDIVKIQSLTEKSESYTVSLKNLTCSCPDFQKRRKDYPATDLRRLCKHLAHALCQSGATLDMPEHINEILMSAEARGAGIPIYAPYIEIILDGQPAAFIGPSSNNWYNVVTRDRKRESPKAAYREFGYNVDEERWSHNYPPPKAKTIRQIIHDFHETGTIPPSPAQQPAKQTKSGFKELSKKHPDKPAYKGTETSPHRCPKCGTPKDPSDIECAHCGIIFEKYIKFQKKQAAQQ